MYLKEIIDAKESAERKLGFQIPKDIATKVLKYASRKCQAIGQEQSYLPILFENELTDHYMRAEINALGATANV